MADANDEDLDLSKITDARTDGHKSTRFDSRTAVRLSKAHYGTFRNRTVSKYHSPDQEDIKVRNDNTSEILIAGRPGGTGS